MPAARSASPASVSRSLGVDLFSLHSELQPDDPAGRLAPVLFRRAGFGVDVEAERRGLVKGRLQALDLANLLSFGRLKPVVRRHDRRKPSTRIVQARVIRSRVLRSGSSSQAPVAAPSPATLASASGANTVPSASRVAAIPLRWVATAAAASPRCRRSQDARPHGCPRVQRQPGRGRPCTATRPARTLAAGAVIGARSWCHVARGGGGRVVRAWPIHRRATAGAKGQSSVQEVVDGGRRGWRRGRRRWVDPTG